MCQYPFQRATVDLIIYFHCFTISSFHFVSQVKPLGVAGMSVAHKMRVVGISSGWAVCSAYHLVSHQLKRHAIGEPRTQDTQMRPELSVAVQAGRNDLPWTFSWREGKGPDGPEIQTLPL